MVSVREVMTSGVECVNEHSTLREAAEKMRDLDVGVLPICGDDEKLKGMVTDRDIITKCIAEGSDPTSTEVGTLAQGRPVMVNVEDSVEDAMAAMADHQVRRVLVLDGKRLAGIVSQHDLGRSIEPTKLGQVSAAVTADNPDQASMTQRGQGLASGM